MKRLTQIAKVSILILCLMIFLINFHQVLRAEDGEFCESEEAPHCVPKLGVDCYDRCDAVEDYCWYWEFSSGYCDDWVCYQYHDIYCIGGYLGTYLYECASFDCPWTKR